MVTASSASLPSPSAQRSTTWPRRSKFTLAPLTTATQSSSPLTSPGCRFANSMAPATASAPAGSGTARTSSNTERTAAQTWSTSTVMTSSSSSRHSSKVSLPACLTATPSANMPVAPMSTGLPASSAAFMLPASSGSTPITRICGCTDFSVAASPAARPPPPTGTNT